MTEAQFNRRIRDLALRCRWLTYHVPDSRRAEPGFPDLVMLRPPRLIFAELKLDRTAPTGIQYKWLLGLCQLGHDDMPEVYVWRPADWDDIVAVLR